MKVTSPAALQITYPEPPNLALMARFLSPEEAKRREDEAKGRMKPLKEYFERAKSYATARAADRKTPSVDSKLGAMIPFIRGKAPVGLVGTPRAGICAAV